MPVAAACMHRPTGDRFDDMRVAQTIDPQFAQPHLLLETAKLI